MVPYISCLMLIQQKPQNGSIRLTPDRAEVDSINILAVDPRAPATSPAACQVVPLVSTERSSSSTSVQPALARW